MKKKTPRLLRTIDTDFEAYERTVVRTACTGSNDDLRALLARMNHRATLHSLESELRSIAPETGES